MGTYQPKRLPKLKCRFMTREEAKQRGFHEFSGPYLAHEWHMLPAIEKDMEMVSRQYVAVTDNPKGIVIFAR